MDCYDYYFVHKAHNLSLCVEVKEGNGVATPSSSTMLMMSSLWQTRVKDIVVLQSSTEALCGKKPVEIELR